MSDIIRDVALFLVAAFNAIVGWFEAFLWYIGNESGIAWVFVLAIAAAAMAVYGLRNRW